MAGLVDTDTADTLFKKADDLQKASTTAFMTEEERKNQPFAQKAVGAVATGGVIAAAGALAAVPTIAAMGASTLLNTPTNLLAKGVDMQRAAAAGLMETAYQTGAILLPAVGSTFLKSAAIGAATNPAQGFLTDLSVSKMFGDRPDIQADYNPYNVEKRALESIVGGVQSVGFHKMYEAGKAAEAKHKAAVDTVLEKEMTEKILPELDASIPGARVKYDDGSGRSKAEQLRSLVDVGDPTNPMGNTKGNVVQAMDLIAQDKEAAPHQVALAERIGRVADILGLDHAKLERQPDEATSAGTYDPKTDVAAVKQKPDHQSFVKTVLHETIHAITHKSVQLWEQAARDPEFRKTLDPHTLDLIRKVENLNTVFEGARAKVLAEKNENMLVDSEARNVYFGRVLDEAKAASGAVAHGSPEWTQHRDFMNEHYGFKNIHEFMSEVMTNPEHFGKRLSKLEIKPEDVPFLKNTSPGRLVNAWQAVKAAFKSLLNLPNGNMYDIAFDHVSGIIDHQQAKTRFANLENKQLTNQTKGLGAALLHRVAGLVANVHTKEELATRLTVQSENKVWQDWVKNNTDRIWDHSYEIMDVASKSNFKDLPESLRKLTGDDRTLDQFIHEEFKDYVVDGKVLNKLTESQDLKGAGRQVYSPSILNLLKKDFGGAVLRFVNQKSVEYKAMGDILRTKATEHFGPFNQLEKKQQLGLHDTIALYDSPLMQKRLKTQDNQWIPIEDLQERGHTPAEIEAYQSLTRGEDFLWSLMNQALVKEGKEPIPQIPGYMPHVFTGAYKVKVNHTTVNPDGSRGDTFVVALKGFQTKQGANGFIKKLNDGGYDKDGNEYRANVNYQTGLSYEVRTAENLSNSLMSGINEHVNAYQNGLILHPEVLQLLGKMEQDNMRGMTKHSLERSGIKGYLGEGGQSKTAWDRYSPVFNKNQQILKIWENYAKNITDYYRNTMFVAEVMAPLTVEMPMELGGRTSYHALFENTGELNQHLHDFGYNYTGKNFNKLGFIDTAAQKLSIKMGVDPMLYRQVSREIRNLLSMVKLRANPTNYIANTMQPMHMYGLLQMANAMMLHDGVKPPNALKSMASAFERTGAFGMRKNDADLDAALSWARHNQHLEAQLEYELHDKNLAPLKDAIHKMTGGEINPTIESWGREMTFKMAYLHMREVYKGDPMRAREAATQLMKMTMIDYTSSQRPLMYQQFGSAGESISPFAVFRNGYIGNTWLMMKLIGQHPLELSAWKPIVATQMIFLATAGMVGMLGASEYNLIVNAWNTISPESEWPSFEELLFKAGVPDWVTFGALSAGTKAVPGLEHGTYVGSSLNAVGADDAFTAALPPFVGALGAAIGYEGQYLLSLTGAVKPPAAQDYYKSQKQLTPGILQPYFDRNLYMKEGNEVAPQSSSLEGGVKREASDWASLYVVGKRSLSEVKESTENRINAQNEEQIKKSKKGLISLGVDNAMGMNKSISMDELRHRAAKYGMDADSFNKEVASGMQNRMLSQRYQEVQRRTLEGEKLRQQRKMMEGTYE